MKNAFPNGDRTFTRKFKELFLTVKLDKQYSKDQILENYLNTIYFGRGAYGIEAAAKTYFGVGRPADRRAGRRARRPASAARALRPADAPRGGQGPLEVRARRHGHEGKLTAADAAKANYPRGPQEDHRHLDDVPQDRAGHVEDQVLDELDQAGYSRGPGSTRRACGSSRRSTRRPRTPPSAR